MPLSNSWLDDSVVKVMSVLDKTLFKTLLIVYTGTADSSLQHAPDFAVATGLKTGLLCGHSHGSMKAGRGGSRNFGKGADKEAKPRTERRRGVWGLHQKFEKLHAISCNLAYIFGIRMASDIIQNWAFAEQKTVAATISKLTDIRKKRLICRVGLWDHTDTHTHAPTLPKTPRISATIKSKFNFKNIFQTLYTM